MPASLFGMIRNTHAESPQLTLTAYKDNAAVVEGFTRPRASAPSATAASTCSKPSAAVGLLHQGGNAQPPDRDLALPRRRTGAGGEIRDEGATGRGGKPKAGLTGFSVSHLRIPTLPQAWEATAAAEPAHGQRASRSCSTARSAPPRSTTSSAAPT